jgi:MarR family transcriptional regulator, transcriptional regulator for hemolysin
MKATNPEDLAARLVCLMDAVARGGGTSVHRLLEEVGVSPGQVKAVLILSGREEPISVGDLGHDLSLSLPTVSRLVDVLARRGWIERQVCSEDRRTRHLLLTATGREFVRQFSAARAADVRVFVERLSKAQCRHLAAALSELELELSAVAN